MFFKIINISLVLMYAIGSGLWVNTGDGWYQSLQQPAWQPPDWVFGVIWPYNFVVLGIIGWIVSNRSPRSINILWSSLLALGVLFALLWAHTFYVDHKLSLAAAYLLLVAIFAFLLLVFSFVNIGAISLIVLPYVVWVSTATALSYSYSKLN